MFGLYVRAWAGNDMEVVVEMIATRGGYHTNAGYRIILATLSIRVRSLDSCAFLDIIQDSFFLD